MSNLEKIISSVPPEAWNKVVDTACDTFRKCIYPVTASTEGVGRFIELKFNQLLDEEKVIASKCTREAIEKVKKAKKRERIGVTIKPIIFYEAFESTDTQTDETIRGIWSNLLANEFLGQDVHPEIAKLLRKLTSTDAILLNEVAQNESTSGFIKTLRSIGSDYHREILNRRKTFNHEYLEGIGLIRISAGTWGLSVLGREFMRCVSDP